MIVRRSCLHRRLRWSGFTLVSLIASSTCVAGESDRDRFLAEYPDAAHQIEQLYKHVFIKCVAEFESHDSSASDQSSAKYQFWADEENWRIDREFPQGDVKASSFVWNDENYFVVDQNQVSSSYRLRSIDPAATDRDQAAPLFPPAFAPYCIDSDPVVDLLKKSEFQLKEVRTEGEGDEQRVIIRWEWPWEGNGPPSRSGEMTFWPAGNWVLTGYVWRQQMPDGTWLPNENFCAIEYDGEVGGSPVGVHRQAGSTERHGRINQTYCHQPNRVDRRRRYPSRAVYSLGVRHPH